jgi:hypothetical protein
MLGMWLKIKKIYITMENLFEDQEREVNINMDSKWK